MFASHLPVARVIAKVGGGDVVARALAFVFFALAARLLSHQEYGEIRYVISTGLVGTAVLAPTTLAMTWFVADASNDLGERERRFVAGSWLSLAVALASSIGTGLIAALLGQQWLEIALVSFGLDVAYYYLQYTKAVQQFTRAGLFPMVSNVIQLLLTSMAFIVDSLRNSLWLVCAYAGSYVVGMLMCERGIPTGFRRRFSLVDLKIAKSILAFALPLVVRHGAYSALLAFDLVLLQHLSSPDQLSEYSVTKTIATVYLVAPYAVYSVLMPKIAAAGSRTFDQQFVLAECATILISVTILAIMANLGHPLVRIVFGPGYEASTSSLIPVGVAMTIYGAIVPVDAVLSGWGRPDVLGFATIGGLLIGVPFAAATLSTGGQIAAGVSLLIACAATATILFGWALHATQARRVAVQ